MATIDNYKIVMDVQGQQAVDRLGKSLGGLGTIIAGIGLASFTSGVLQMADAISDLASATGLAVKDIVAFENAIAQAGGKSEQAGKMLAGFYQIIDKAANGSEEAQKALQKVGITFNDLGNLSEKDLLAKALKTLSAMGPGAERTAAGMDVLTKAFRNIDPKTAEAIFQLGSDADADGIIKMANAADSLAANFRTLQLASASVFPDILTSLEPFIGKVAEGKLTLEQAKDVIKGIGIALGIAFGVKTVATIMQIVGAVRLLTTAIKGTAIAQTALVALSGPRGWAMIAAGALATTAAIVGLNKALDDTNDNVEDLTGGKPATGATDTGPKRKTQFFTDQELQARKQALTVAQQTTYQQGQQNKAAQDYQRIINSTIGMKQDEADIIKLTASLEQDAANKILDLNKQIDVEKSKGRATNQGIITELEKQKQQVTDNLSITKQLKLEELARADAIKQQVLDQQVLGNYMVVNSKIFEDTNANSIRMRVAVGRLTEEQGNRELELDRMRYENINRRNALQIQANQQEVQGLTRERQLTLDLMDDEKERYTSAIRLIKERYDIEDAKRKSISAGVTSAMDQIAKSMDPFNLAQQATLGLFGKINDSITQLVTTGRTSFSDLAKSFGQMILEMMLKQQVAKAASAATGWLDALFSNLFKAEGGPVKGGQPYIVGEKGPELFVPPSAGSIIPNNKMASASPASAMASTANNTYITNNISAIDAKSVAQLFAENRRTLFGSVQLAQKELSYGR